MSVHSALQVINQELDLYFNGELERESRFCVELYTHCAFNTIKFGEADVLARAKNTSVDKLRVDGILYSEKGMAHLLTREELSRTVDKNKGIWLLTQQLAHAMETDGVMGAAWNNAEQIEITFPTISSKLGISSAGNLGTIVTIPIPMEKDSEDNDER